MSELPQWKYILQSQLNFRAKKIVNCEQHGMKLLWSPFILFCITLYMNFSTLLNSVRAFTENYLIVAKTYTFFSHWVVGEVLRIPHSALQIDLEDPQRKRKYFVKKKRNLYYNGFLLCWSNRLSQHFSVKTQKRLIRYGSKRKIDLLCSHFNGLMHVRIKSIIFQTIAWHKDHI